MKKFLSLALALTLCASTLAACGNNEDVEDTNTPNPGSTSEVVEGDSSMDIDVDNTVTVASANARLAYIIDQARPAEVIEAIKTATNNNDGALMVLGLDETMVDEYAVAYSLMNVKAYAVALVKPVEGQEEAVKTAIESYQASMIKSFEQYLPDQLAIAQAAVIIDEGDYCGIVMCEGADDIAAAMVGGIKDIDSIVIDETLVTEEEDANSDTAFDAADPNATIDESGNPSEVPGDEGPAPEEETSEFTGEATDGSDVTTDNQAAGQVSGQMATNEDTVDMPTESVTTEVVE